MPAPHDLFEALASEISLIDCARAERFLGRSRSATCRLLRAYVGEGLLDTAIVHASPPLDLQDPLFVWSPGDAEPRCGSLSHKARSRAVVPAVPTRVFYLTPSAADLFGGLAISKATILESAHELNMTELWLRFRETRGDTPVSWMRGDIFAGTSLPKVRVPDAMILCECGCGTIQKAIEFAGCSYSSTRIRSFHRFCQQNEIPYELW